MTASKENEGDREFPDAAASTLSPLKCQVEGKPPSGKEILPCQSMNNIT
jgi:hypothetical protein